MIPKKSAIRTFSQEEEEERTALISLQTGYTTQPSSSAEGVNKLANEAADESRSHQQSTSQ